MKEVRFERLRPAQIVERRNECPVAYIPLGTLEWHSVHMPLGADGLQAQEIALRCAEKGGVVFPPVYYGESRVGSLLETDPKYQSGIAERLEMPVELLRAERQMWSGMEQIEHYQHHLVHIISEAASYGFKLAVLIIGHYPLIDHARAAALSYNQWAYDKGWEGIGVIPAADFVVMRNHYENPGDHAGKWETSHLLASDPETVDMNLAEDEYVFGVLSNNPPKTASAEFGNEVYDIAVKDITALVDEYFKNPNKFKGHGMYLP
jgi:creatinine amidohydrolase